MPPVAAANPALANALGLDDTEMGFIEEHVFGRPDPPRKQIGVTIFAQGFITQKIGITRHHDRA